MSISAHPFRGPLFMVLATGSYVVNDTFMKVAMDGLPPYQTLMLRGAWAAVWGLPLLFLLGYGRSFAQMFEPAVVMRNLAETGGILCFVVALANMPIADATALGQVTPLLVLIGAALFFNDRISAPAAVLIGIGFAGALMIAQPSGSGISVYALLALANAVLCALRDLLGRRIAGHVPGMIVAISAVLIVLAGASVGHLATETWVAPQARHVAILAGSGFFLIFGHFFLFMAYRIGPTSAVAPFYYGFSVWAVISGLVVFGQFPNRLALAGIVMVVGSGLAIVAISERRRRLLPAS